jgi:hypothetical protein
VEVPHGVVVEEEEVGELPRTKCLLWFYHYLHLTVANLLIMRLYFFILIIIIIITTVSPIEKECFETLSEKI